MGTVSSLGTAAVSVFDGDGSSLAAPAPQDSRPYGLPPAALSAAQAMRPRLFADDAIPVTITGRRHEVSREGQGLGESLR